jgi:hypothetical protein
MDKRTKIVDGEDTQPSRVTGNPDTDAREGEQEIPNPPVERLKDDLMQDEEDTDGHV